MSDFFTYMLETSVCIAVFYPAYLLLLRRDTFFTIGRCFILSTALMSFIIPSLVITANTESQELIYAEAIRTIVISADNIENTVKSSLSSWEIASVIYLSGVGIFLIRFLIQMFQLLILIKKSGINKIDGYKIVFTEGKFAPFSFFNIIFLNKSFIYNIETEQILAHEKIHIDRYHTIDILLMEFLTILQWFNPFIWFYRSNIKDIHEFEADAGVVCRGFDKINYQELILKQISGAGLFQSAHNFNYLSIKRRIIMLSKSRTKKIAALKLLLVLPVSALLVLAFSCSNKSPDQMFVNDSFTVTWKEKPDSYPEPSIGWKAHYDYIKKNLKVPKEFIDRGIPGKVEVRFEVMKDGSISNPRVTQSQEMGCKWKHVKLGYGCDEEAIRIVKNMGKWKPANYKGKAVDMTRAMLLMFGDEDMKRKWYEYDNDKNNWQETRYEYEPGKKPKNKHSSPEPIPEFPGGYSKMTEYITKNIKYPEEARKNGIEGTVHVVFDLKPDGSISNVKVVQSIGYGCDEEAVRVIKSMPKWDLHNDIEKKTDVQMKIPIQFKLQEKVKKEQPIQTKVRYESQKNEQFIDLDEMPKMDTKVFLKNFIYPEVAKKNGISGTVHIKAKIGKEGKVLKVYVEESDYEILNESAINAVQKTGFTPAKKDGKNVEAWVTIPVKYKLK